MLALFGNPQLAIGVCVDRAAIMAKFFTASLLLAAVFCLGQQPHGHSKPPHAICTPVPKGKIIRFVPPIYPSDVPVEATAEGLAVSLTIDKQGVPKNIHVTQGNPIVARPALEAIQQWRWKPYRLNGKPVEVDSTVYIRFDPLAN